MDDAIQKLKKTAGPKKSKKPQKTQKNRDALPAAIPKDLAYVEGALFEDYLHDMRLIRRFADLNRKAMVDEILTGMGLTREEAFTTVHNYIDTDAMILRKGAVSAGLGEKLLIPINMRDGSLICVGRGNADWNFSAPHGAGRLMSRKDAFAVLSPRNTKHRCKAFTPPALCRIRSMNPPWPTKSLGDIVRHIQPTAEVVGQIKPVFNFKASK